MTDGDAMDSTWRLIYNPEGDITDIPAYPAALAVGRIAGRYLPFGLRPTDTVVIQGIRKKGILAGADISVDRQAAEKHGIDIAVPPRPGKRGAKPVDTIQLEEIVAPSSKKFTAAACGPDDPAVILYTSGTTGMPKGVMLSHRNFHAQCSGVVARIFPLTVEDRLTGVLPLYHIYALSNGLVASVYFGAALCLIPQYSPAILLDTIFSTRATILLAIPSMYMNLLTLARIRKTKIPQTLTLCVSGGAPLSQSVLSDFEKVFHTRIVEGYGLTETTSSVCMNRSGEGFKPGSIGPAAPGIDMKIVDDQGRNLPDGQTGEIVIRAAVVTQGYWNNPQATAAAIRDGWLHTGDIGHRDPDGYFFITDRKKDLIIRGGFNISPREIEELLISHNAVQDAAVIGVKDKRDEEAVKAFVVRKPNEIVSEKELFEYCSANLAPYKVPKIIEFRETLPRSAAGKVLKKELRPDYVDIRLMQQQSQDIPQESTHD
jgi:long-chain acyl-CoA synthetase